MINMSLAVNYFQIFVFATFAIALTTITHLLVKKIIGNNCLDGMDELYQKIKNDINTSVAPKFIDLSPVTKDVIDMAVEVWRMEQRISKLNELSEIQKKGLENSIQKFRRFIEKNDIETIDYTSKKFNDGLNLEILNVEKDPTISEPRIKETIEPAIMHKGQIVRRAKIILITNN